MSTGSFSNCVLLQKRPVWGSTIQREHLDSCCDSAGVMNAHVPKVSGAGIKPGPHISHMNPNVIFQTWLYRRPDLWRTRRPLPRACTRATALGCALTLFLLCALENCSMQKKGNISNADRTAKACETEQFSKIDYGNRWLRFESGRLDKRSSAPVTSVSLLFSVQSETARLYKEFIHWRLHRASVGRHQRRWAPFLTARCGRSFPRMLWGDSSLKQNVHFFNRRK